MLCRVNEVIVRGEQGQLVTHAQLSEQGVDGAELHPATAAGVAEISSGDVVAAVRLDHGQSLEGLYDLRSGVRAGEALQKLLKNQACCHDDFVPKQRFAQCLNRRQFRLNVTPQSERPDTGVDKQAHERLRSAL